MMDHITVRETKKNRDGSFSLVLCSKSARKEVPEFRIPARGESLWGNSEAEWLFSSFATDYPYEQARADCIGAAIDRYGSQLLVDLDLVAFIKSNAQDATLLRLEICGSSEFQAIHWEALERAYAECVDRPASASVPMPRLLAVRVAAEKGVKMGLKPPSQQPERPFNILMIVARPSGIEDLDPLICSGALVDAIRQAQAKNRDHVSALNPKVEISRPGTWKAFEELLTSRTEGWHRRGGQGPWYDIVHFDVHGAIFRNNPYLLFLDPTGTKAHAKSASVIAKLLVSCRIEFVLLNSCESAKVDGPATACLVRKFAEVGINTVVGMSHKLTGTAAKALVRAFYLRLLLYQTEWIG